MPPESLGILSSLHAEAAPPAGQARASPSWSGCHTEITFGTVKDAPQRMGRTGFFSHSIPGSLEGLGFHAWNHAVRNSLSQASCNVHPGVLGPRH